MMETNELKLRGRIEGNIFNPLFPPPLQHMEFNTQANVGGLSTLTCTTCNLPTQLEQPE